jgi:hypothetical protein
MSARTIFDHAPIGSIIAWSDGMPRPAEHHRKKLSDWQSRNSKGRLIARRDERDMGKVTLPGSFTLHEADLGARGIIAIRIHRTFSTDSRFVFTVVERPAVGAIRVFDRAGEGAELVYLAAHRAEAEAWLTRHGYPDAVLDEVIADEAGTGLIEGRAA